MHSVETYRAQALHNLNKTAGAFDKAHGNATKAITIAFLTYAATDPSLTPGDVSKLLIDHCGPLKSGTLAVVRSRCKSALAEVGECARLYAACPVDKLEVADFIAAIDKHAETFDPRAMEEARKARIAEAANVIKAAAIVANTAQAAADVGTLAEQVEKPAVSAIFNLQTSILKDMDTLAMLAIDDDDALAALRAVYDAAFAAMATLSGIDAEEERQAA